MRSPVTVQLSDGVEAQVEPGAALDWPPRLALRELQVSLAPFASGSEHEQFLKATVGSGAWYLADFDEARFAPPTGLLAGLWLHVPVARDDGAAVRTWQSVEPTRGLPRLLEPAPFNLEPCVRRSAAPDGSALAAFRFQAEPPGTRLRLRVGEGFDLLFAAGWLCGWLLEVPETALSSGFGPRSPGPADPALNLLLAEYLNSSQPGQEPGPALRATLKDIAQRAGGTSGPRRGTFIRCVKDHLAHL